MSPIDQPLTRRFIEDAGNATQSLGVGRVVGQIYAYLYFSEPPRTLDDMKESLGISKGSASMGVRQLEQWGAVQRVWVKGDRKDYYTASDYFGSIIRNILADIMGKRLASLAQSLETAENEIGSASRAKWTSAEQLGNSRFIRERVARLREFREKVEKTVNNPLIKIMLK